MTLALIFFIFLTKMFKTEAAIKTFEVFVFKVLFLDQKAVEFLCK
jgi:hypothetical protein